MTTKELFSTGDVAKILGVSQATVFRAIEKSALKASTTPGGHYRIARADLEDFLRANNVPSEVLAPRVKRILVVEDNPLEMRMIQRSLAQEPLLDVRATGSGYEAGFLTKSYRPDLILLDIFLGDADGRQIITLIRQDPDLRHTKIIAMTASKEAAVLEEIHAAGVDDFVPKPLQPEELLDRIRRLLR